MPHLLTEPLAYHTALLIAIAAVFAVCCLASTGWRGAAVHVATIVAALLIIDARIHSLPVIFTIIPLLFIAADAIFYLGPFGTPRRRFLGTTAVLVVLFVGLAQTPLAPFENFGQSNDEDAIHARIDCFEPLADSPFRTDRDRTVDVREFRGDPAGLDAEIRRLQKALLEKNHLAHRVVALETVWEPSNCHGHIFTGGKYSVPNEEMQAILDDNGYHQIVSPRIGDLAIYRDACGAIAHSGVVVGAANGTWLVESKWGKLGCFAHPCDVYLSRGLVCEFVRSNRLGHLLRRTDDAADNAKSPPQAP